MSVLPLCLALLAQAATPTPSAAPTPKPTLAPPITFEVDVDVVSITAVVHDKAGRFVRGLSAADVEVYEDGVKQDLTYFRDASGPAEEKIPLSVALVLDSSGSMAKNMHLLQEAAVTFANKLEEVDTALVIQFNNSIKGSVEFTGDEERLIQFIESLEAWGGTSLFDAVHYGLSRVKDQQGRKAIVVFSDGDDTTSSLKEQEVIDYARSVEATVYSVGIRGGGGVTSRGPRGFLRKIAQESGGAFFFPERVGDLIKIFSSISDELHNHYVFAYSPKKPPDNGWRTILVKVNRPDVEVRVRQGYFAVKRRK
jgi:VWFA-related protein